MKFTSLKWKVCNQKREISFSQCWGFSEQIFWSSDFKGCTYLFLSGNIWKVRVWDDQKLLLKSRYFFLKVRWGWVSSVFEKPAKFSQETVSNLTACHLLGYTTNSVNKVFVLMFNSCNKFNMLPWTWRSFSVLQIVYWRVTVAKMMTNSPFLTTLCRDSFGKNFRTTKKQTPNVEVFALRYVFSFSCCLQDSSSNFVVSNFP